MPVACVLAVSDTFDASGARRRIDDDALLAAAERMGAGAIAALSQEPALAAGAALSDQALPDRPAPGD